MSVIFRPYHLTELPLRLHLSKKGGDILHDGFYKLILGSNPLYRLLWQIRWAPLGWWIYSVNLVMSCKERVRSAN